MFNGRRDYCLVILIRKIAHIDGLGETKEPTNESIFF